MSSEREDVLSQLIGGSPRSVLQALASLGVALAKAGRARPEVECYLASGQVVRGRILDVAEERGGAVALLHLAGPVHAPSVAYVRIDQVAAVVVTDASLLVRAPAIDAPTPSRLELARQLEARTDALAAILGRRLPLALAASQDDEARQAIGLALPVVASVLGAIAGDELGKVALGELEAIEVGAAPSLQLFREEPKRLVLRVPSLVTEPLSAERLRTELEKLL